MSGKNQAPVRQRSGKFEDYFWANLLFLAFVGLLAVLVWASCSSPTDDPNVTAILWETLKFILLLFGLGFLAVTLLDAAYDFFAEKAESPVEPPKAS